MEPTVRSLLPWSDWLAATEPFSILYLNQIKLGWSWKRRSVPSMNRIKKFTPELFGHLPRFFLLESNKFMLPALRRFHWLCWVSWWPVHGNPRTSVYLIQIKFIALQNEVSSVIGRKSLRKRLTHYYRSFFDSLFDSNKLWLQTVEVENSPMGEVMTWRFAELLGHPFIWFK